MRELKFRAWDTDNKAWIYSDHIEGLAWFFNMVEKYNCELMQYTGLKDKNGREIYEGDIVALVWDFGEDGIKKSKLGIVTFGELFAEIYLVTGWYVSNNGQQVSEAGLDSDYVLLGNIYENPELLE